LEANHIFGERLFAITEETLFEIGSLFCFKRIFAYTFFLLKVIHIRWSKHACNRAQTIFKHVAICFGCRCFLLILKYFSLKFPLVIFKFSCRFNSSFIKLRTLVESCFILSKCCELYCTGLAISIDWRLAARNRG
jgi:hypothetical protein